MQFNAIIGNPPYQSETGGAGRQAKPVYNHFIDCAKMMEPGYISMIMPSRWFAGGMNLDDFRDNMVNDERISKIVDYTNAKECFPQISISGGICYLLWDKLHQGNCDFINIKNGNKTQISRKLNEFKILVRYNSAISILHKILDKPDNKFRCFDEIISPLMPFGLPTNYRGDITPSADKNIALYASDCLTYINESEIAKGHEYLNKYNIMMSKMSAEHAGEPDRDGKFKVFTNTMRVLKPNEACTHSYFLIGNTPNKEEAENIKAYLETKFVRFLVLMALSAVNLSKFVFIFVPLLDFSKQWDDESLFAFYNFDENEINFINSMVKPM